MDDDTLTIYLKLITTDADRADAAQHQRFRQRIKETGSFEAGLRKANAEEEKRERDYNLREKIKVEQDFNKRVAASRKQVIQEQINSDNEYIRAKRKQASDLAALDKQAFASWKQQHMSQHALTMQNWNTEQAAAKRKAAEVAAADKQAFASWKQDHENRHKLIMMQWSEEQKKAKEANAFVNREERQQAQIRTALERHVQDEKKEAAKGAAREQARLARELDKDSEKTRSGILNIAQAYTTLRIASEVGQWATAALHAMGQAAKEARDRVAELGDKLAAMREKSGELLAMQGIPRSAEEISNLSTQAAGAGVTTDTFIKASMAFREQAQGRIEPPDVTPERAKFYSMTEESAKEMTKEAMTRAEDLHIPQAAAMQLLDTIEKVAPHDKDGKTDKNYVMGEYNKILKVVQSSRGNQAQLATQLAESGAKLVGEGGGIKDINRLAVLGSIAAEVSPKKVTTLLSAGARGIRQLFKDPKKMSELGLTGNEDYETAMNKSIDAISIMAKHQGIPESAVASEYFNDEREYTDYRAVKEFGINRGMFAQREAEMGDISPAGLIKSRTEGQAANTDYLRGKEGREKSATALGERAEVRLAGKSQEYRIRMKEAYESAVSGGLIGESQGMLNQILAGKAEQFGEGTPEQQRVYKLMMKTAFTEATRAAARAPDSKIAEMMHEFSLPGHDIRKEPVLGRIETFLSTQVGRLTGQDPEAQGPGGRMLFGPAAGGLGQQESDRVMNELARIRETNQKLVDAANNRGAVPPPMIPIVFPWDARF